jgi:hypothetical protein
MESGAIDVVDWYGDALEPSEGVYWAKKEFKEKKIQGINSTRHESSIQSPINPIRQARVSNIV